MIIAFIDALLAQLQVHISIWIIAIIGDAIHDLIEARARSVRAFSFA